MSDYGADADPDILAAQDLAYTKGLLPLDKTNVMQWTYPSGIVVRKLANKQDKSNILFKMGLEPVPAGDPCPVCWGDGKPFGAGATPETVTVILENIEKGPNWDPFFGEPPDGAFTLPQIDGLPCVFEFNDASYSIFYDNDAVNSDLGIFTADFSAEIFNATELPCHMFFENTVTDIFTGGTATIFIPPVT